jgi:peptidyl-prolyl cis-trans isomerase D
MLLENLRAKTQSKFAKIILVLILVPFALFGLDSYVRNSSSGDAAAKVGRQEISVNEFNNAYRTQQQQMQSILGAQYDAAAMDNPEARKAVLDNLINNRLMVAEAADAGMAISDARLAKRIAEIPNFQEDGKFSKTKYQTFLRGSGYTERGFEARMREDMLIQQLRESVTDTPIVPQTVVDNFIRAQEQTREISVANFTPEQFIAQVKLADGAAKAYYDAHQPEFEIPQQVKLEYLVMSADQLGKQIAVSDDEVKKFYDANAKDKYIDPEQRKAAHILINAAPSATDAEKKAAKEKADDLYSQAKKNPAGFAELAKKNSQDIGSGKQGGDLGFFGKGMMVKPFQDATFAMKKGEIHEPVLSDFGYHIIQLNDIKPEKVRSLYEASGEIQQELKKQKGEKVFSEKAEGFGTTVFEQSGSLKAAADKYELKIQQSDWLSRKSQAAPPLNSDKLLNAVFSDAVLKEKRNTEAIDTAPNTLVAARLLESKPATIKPFDEVKAKIQEKLIRDDAVKAASKEGLAQLAAVKEGKELGGSKWATPLKITRDKSIPALPPQAAEAAFKMAAGKLPAYAGIETAQGYLLIKLTQVQDGGAIDDAKRKNYSDRIKSASVQQDLSGFLATLRAGTSVKINEAAVLKKEVQ